MSDTYISQRAIIDIPILHLSERKEYLSANEHEIYEQGYQDALDKAATLPPADVVKVVRCKDCKYRESDDFCVGRGFPYQLVAGDEYCSRAKTKEHIND